MNQIQVWFEMMKDLKNQQGRGVSSLDAQQGEPHGSAMYQWQLAQAGRDQAEEERRIRMALLASQGEQAYQQARLTGAQAATEGMKTYQEPIGHSELFGGPHRDYSFPFMPTSGGGGGGGTMAGLVPNESMAEEDARKKKGRAEAAMYDSMVSGDSYVGPGAGWGATYSSPSYDLSTSSYGPSSGSGNSW
jgi:hypothetical protein